MDTRFDVSYNDGTLSISPVKENVYGECIFYNEEEMEVVLAKWAPTLDKIFKEHSDTTEN